MFRIFFLFVIILISQVVKANYWFEKLETSHGVGMVSSLYRDHRGFLWIGDLSMGLLRFDAYEIKSFLFDPNDSLSISSSDVNSIYEDSYNMLWIGTSNGLNRYVPEKDQFIRYSLSEEHDSYFPSNFINEVVEGKDSLLWILTRNGIFRYNREKDIFDSFFNNDELASNHFTCIDWDVAGRIWCGARGKNGLYLFNPKDSSFKYYDDNSLSSTIIGSKRLLIDGDNNFWYGHQGVGFAKFDPLEGEFKYFPVINNGKGTLGSFIYQIMEVDSVNLFIAMDQGGINIYNRKTNEFKYATNENPLYGNLSSNGIYCLHKDKEPDFSYHRSVKTRCQADG